MSLGIAIQNRSAWAIGALIMNLALLSACSSVKTGPSVTPQGERDGVPLGQLDPASIQDAIPRPEVPGRAGNFSPYTVLGKTYEVLPTGKGYRAEGVASWYGRKFHGRKTSNGEVFDAWGMTAAHKTLPIPAYLRVTNLENGRTTIVRVNDRGPFHGDRILDLSYAAAVKLGFADRGTAPVRIETIDFSSAERDAVLPDPAAAQTVRAEAGTLYLQVGAFRNPVSAANLRARVQTLTGHLVHVVTSEDTEPVHRVRVGPLPDVGEVEVVKAALEQASIPTGLLVRESASF